MQQAVRVKVEPGMQTPAAQLDGFSVGGASDQRMTLQRVPDTFASHIPPLQVPVSMSEQLPLLTPTTAAPANASSSSPPNRKTGTAKRSTSVQAVQAKGSRPNKLPGYHIQHRQLQQLMQQQFVNQDHQVVHEQQQQDEQRQQQQQEQLFQQFQHAQQQQQQMQVHGGCGQTLSQYLYRHRGDLCPNQEQQQQDQQEHLEAERDPSSWQQQQRQWQLADAGEDQQHEYSPDLGPLPPLLPLNLDSTPEDPNLPSTVQQQNPMDLTLTPAKPRSWQDPDAAAVATLSPLGHQALTSSHANVTSSSHPSSGRHKRLRLSIAESSACHAAAACTPASPSAAFTPLDVATTTPGKLFTSQGFGSPQGLASPQGFTPGAGTGPMNSPNQPPLGLFSRFGTPVSPSDSEPDRTAAAAAGGGAGTRSSCGAAAAGEQGTGREQQLMLHQLALMGETSDGTNGLGVAAAYDAAVRIANWQQQQQDQTTTQQQQEEEEEQGAPACSATEISAAWGGSMLRGDAASAEEGLEAAAAAGSGDHGGIRSEWAASASGCQHATHTSGPEGQAAVTAAAATVGRGQYHRQGLIAKDQPAAAGVAGAGDVGTAAGGGGNGGWAAGASQEESYCAPSTSQQAAGNTHRMSFDASCQTRGFMSTPTTWGLHGGEAVTPSTLMGGALTPSTTAGVVTFTPLIPAGFVPNGAGTPFGGASRVVGVTSVVRGSSGVLLERNCWDRVVPGRGAGQGKGV